ncbi:TPA: hypothetical protein DCZ32_04865 [Candidatus Uhrbacteria bacterium]|nr:hypothetical protein [Candidatus Uhrbacteria bacterium]
MKKQNKKQISDVVEYGPVSKFLFINFLGGIARGVGAFVGSFVLIGILLWILSFTSFGQTFIETYRALKPF